MKETNLKLNINNKSELPNQKIDKPLYNIISKERDIVNSLYSTNISSPITHTHTHALYPAYYNWLCKFKLTTAKDSSKTVQNQYAFVHNDIK